MTLREFENGYWYVDDLRDFATQIGIPEATRLRKDETSSRGKKGGARGSREVWRLVSLESLARRANYEWEPPYLWRPRSALRRAKQIGTVR